MALRVFGNLLGLVIFGLIAWSAWNVALSDYERGRFYEGVLRIPQWPAKAFFVLGLGLLSARLFLNMLQDSRAFLKGEPRHD
jgi:TRAP-type C4-dicarboxylate transport system permease small subunit